MKKDETASQINTKHDTALTSSLRKLFQVYSTLPQDIKEALSFREFIDVIRGEEENHVPLSETHPNA